MVAEVLNYGGEHDLSHNSMIHPSKFVSNYIRKGQIGIHGGCREHIFFSGGAGEKQIFHIHVLLLSESG